MNRHVLIVEDEPKIAQLHADYLENSHYSSSCLDNGIALNTDNFHPSPRYHACYAGIRHFPIAVTSLLTREIITLKSSIDRYETLISI